jgi:hypothetical protein
VPQQQAQRKRGPELVRRAASFEKRAVDRYDIECGRPRLPQSPLAIHQLADGGVWIGEAVRFENYDGLSFIDL